MNNSDRIAVTKSDIEQAMTLISPQIRRTPVLKVKPSDCEGVGASKLHQSLAITLKLEYLQCSGSFKARGAFNNLLSQAIPTAGVVAASGGNHGAAVAFAARELGVKAHIFVPTVSSVEKQRRIEQLGAKLVVGGDRYADALISAAQFAEETGALAVDAYNTNKTLAGAGTTALELVQQAPDIDTVLVAVGGGGLIGGMAAYVGDRIKVVAVETEGTPTLHSALKAGSPVKVATSGIATDSLGASQVGTLCFPLLQRYVAESLLVTDEAVTQAQSLLWNNFRIVAEPGGAAAFAALSSGVYRPDPNEQVAVLICGANTSR